MSCTHTPAEDLSLPEPHPIPRRGLGNEDASAVLHLAQPRQEARSSRPELAAHTQGTCLPAINLTKGSRARCTVTRGQLAQLEIQRHQNAHRVATAQTTGG